MATTRQARAIWNGDLLKGSGAVSALSSRKFSDLAVSWAARTEAPEGKTSPEELLAASHASCFCMALSAGLAKAGTPPQRLDATTVVRMDDVEGRGHQIVKSTVTMRARVPGADESAFARAVETGDEGCPFSTLLRNAGVDVVVNAELEEE